MTPRAPRRLAAMIAAPALLAAGVVTAAPVSAAAKDPERPKYKRPPVDPGPNFKGEIPDALKALLSGGIYIDEQKDLPDGGKQIRALHVHLVVAPSALQTLLNSTIAEVRAAAERLTATVESLTGETLN